MSKKISLREPKGSWETLGSIEKSKGPMKDLVDLGPETRIGLRKVNAEEEASQQDPCPLPNCASQSNSNTKTRCKGKDKGRIKNFNSQGIGLVHLPQKDRNSYCLRSE